MKESFLATLLIIASVLSVSAAEIHFYAGAGLRQPVDQLIEDFQEKTGHRVLADYDGGGRLLARIIASGRGDLFMPGAFFYIEKLKDRGMIWSWQPVVHHTPVIAVNKSSTKKVTKFEDLAKPGVRLALGDPKAMAFGRTAFKILERSGLKPRIVANVVVYGGTVKQLALYVAQGYVDASIVGRSDAFQFRDRVEMIPIPSAYFEAETVAVAVLTTALAREAATALQDFVSSPKAINVFQKFGFLPLE
ncbi:MAG: molybdate ABC transporter substrate-binding protein [Deltaproteobacteria bacterium]|nr:molybdate ABC transporter substrate-binding protein [Deltaproteobacteria bacterium]MBW2138477.1 molybdate ABC transporter substrate-binding protein [Deltaproteobacteria bacterium]